MIRRRRRPNPYAPPKRSRGRPEECCGNLRSLRRVYGPFVGINRLKDLALRIKVSPGVLSEIERGKKGASERVLLLLADTYGIAPIVVRAAHDVDRKDRHHVR